ncbi:MAG TPA: alpha/beta fold hydrolase [Planosporangium sp.]|jgi:pimeloyl-ACP methyl ester carboxylesterase|nr:alpha/beta fold hydrolase [Planosporangium sp.]
MTEFVLEVPGGRLQVEETGAGEPVLLLHAGVTDSRVWDVTGPLLVSAGYRVVRYDARGFGRSPASERPFSPVADALAVLDATGVPAAHFVGLSRGAATAVDVALAVPHRVRTLTLVAPGLSGYEWPRLPGREQRLAAAEYGDMHGLALEVAHLWAPMSFQAGDQPEDFASRVVREQAEAFMTDELEAEQPPALPRLGGITAPTLVVLGDRDVEAVERIGRLLSDEIPGATLVTLTGADHVLPLRVPDRLHSLLVEHLRRG